MCLHKASTACVLKVKGDILWLLELKYDNFYARLCGCNVYPVARRDISFRADITLGGRPPPLPLP